MKSEFMIAITQLAAEKNLPREVILDAMEAALVSAYKKDSDLQGNIVVRIDRETGEHHVFHEQTVVAEVEDPKTQIALPDARKIKPGATMDDVISTEVHPSHAGRIAAQTAKQVVLQRLREAEREMVFEEFSNREGDVVSGVIQRIDAKHIVVDLGKTEAILPPPEQVRTEHYRPGQRQKFYLLEVHRSLKGPQLILSRTHKNLLRRLFELEVPEIHKGIVEIRSIAREAGYRSKVAVTARQEGVDPVGSCVGLRGIRIQNIVNELNGERIDVVQWDQDAARFVANALSPAQVLNVTVSEETNTASVVVPDRQLSLAIGREGQNARLAAKLTGWRIDIKPESAMQEVLAAAAATAKPAAAAPAAPAAPSEEREAQPWMEVIEGEGAEAAPAVAEPAAEAVEAPAAAAATAETAAGGIRFAEEVLPPPAGDGDGKKRKKTKKVERKPEETEAKAKKTKRTRRPVIVEEEEEEEFEEFEA
ncbi:MAG: transcription termination factor NusA [Dehalococcoidia bacterium]|nr:transcription termination factor NusA [Dehalococcoidia bacterium]